MVIVYIIGGDGSTLRAKFKLVLKECERSEPTFIYTMYTGGLNWGFYRKFYLEIPKPVFLDNSTNCKKVCTSKTVSKSDISNIDKPHVVSKLDAIQIKKFWVYAEKHHQYESLDNFIKLMHATIKHVLNNHKLCGRWCMQKKKNPMKKRSMVLRTRIKTRETT